MVPAQNPWEFFSDPIVYISDDENVSREVAPTKKKRQLSQEQMNKLAIACEKANLVMKTKSEEKLKIRERKTSENV